MSQLREHQLSMVVMLASALPDLPESTELGAWVLLGRLAFEVLAANVALKKKKGSILWAK